MSKLFATLSSCLSVLHNYFDDPTKLFSDLYLAKFLDTSAKLFLSFVSFVPSEFVKKSVFFFIRKKLFILFS